MAAASTMPWRNVNKLSFTEPSSTISAPKVAMPEPMHRLWPRWEENAGDPPSLRHADRPSVSVRSIAAACQFYETKCAAMGYESVASRYLYQLSREVQSQLRAAEHHIGDIENELGTMKTILKDWRENFSPRGKLLCSDVPRLGIPLKNVGTTPSDVAACLCTMAQEIKSLKAKNSALRMEQSTSEATLQATIESHMSASTASAVALRAELARETRRLEKERDAWNEKLQAEVKRVTASSAEEVAYLRRELAAQKAVEAGLRANLDFQKRSGRREAVRIIKRARARSQVAWGDEEDAKVPEPITADSLLPVNLPVTEGELSEDFRKAMEESNAEADMLRQCLAQKERLCSALRLALSSQLGKTGDEDTSFIAEPKKCNENLPEPPKNVQPWDKQGPRKTDAFMSAKADGPAFGPGAVFAIIAPPNTSTRRRVDRS